MASYDLHMTHTPTMPPLDGLSLYSLQAEQWLAVEVDGGGFDWARERAASPADHCGDTLCFLDTSFDSNLAFLGAHRRWAAEPCDALTDKFGTLGISPAQGIELAAPLVEAGHSGLHQTWCRA